MTAALEPAPRLPPRFVIRAAWVVHRAVYGVTGGRRGLRQATPEQWGMMRLRTVDPDERPRLWATWAVCDKGLDEYAARRSRETQVVILEPRAERNPGTE